MKLKTAIFKTSDLLAVERLARQHLNNPRVGRVGRLACVQSDELQLMNENNANAIAESFDLPLVAFREVEAFEPLSTSPLRALAAPPDVIDVEGTPKEDAG